MRSFAVYIVCGKWYSCSVVDRKEWGGSSEHWVVAPLMATYCTYSHLSEDSFNKMISLISFWEHFVHSLFVGTFDTVTMWKWKYTLFCINKYWLSSWGNSCICSTESDVEEKEPPVKKEKEKPHKKKEKGYKTFEQEVSMESDEER